MAKPDELLKALDLAFAQDWAGVLDRLSTLEPDATTAWLAAIALKALGRKDAAQAKYTSINRAYDLFPAPKIELRAVFHEVVHERREA